MNTIETDGLQLIGHGVSGDVFAIDDQRVVKVFHEPFTFQQVSRAYEDARFIGECGIPTAGAYEMIQSGERFGIVYEYLREPTLLSCIAKGEIKREDAAVKMGKMLKRLHGLPLREGIQTLGDMAGGILERCGAFLSPERRKELLGLIDRFPGCSVLHGDFHENNILVRGDEYLLIDLDSVCTGSPLFEMEHLFCIYKTGIPKGLKLSVSDGERFLMILLANYFDTDDSKLLAEYNEIFTDVSAFSVFFSDILRTPKGMEDATRNTVEEVYPDLIRRLDRASEKYDRLPWR
jgi:hypothetical protein